MSPVCQDQGRGREEVVFTCASRCSPTRVLLAAHQSTVTTWRERRREVFESLWGLSLWGWIFSSTCIPAYRFSLFHTHTHTHTHVHSYRLVLIPHTFIDFFFPCELSISSIYVIPASRKIGVSSADWGRCLFRTKQRVIQDDSFSLAIQVCLHHQLATCHKRSNIATILWK